MVFVSKRWFLSLLLCCLSLQILAQEYAYLEYSHDTGAPFNEVNTIIQDNKGFIWIGTKNGLYRYDGHVFELQSDLTESQNIHQIHQYNEKLYFINDKGLYEIDNSDANPQIRELLEATLETSDKTLFFPNDFMVSGSHTKWISQSNHSLGQFKNHSLKNLYFSVSDKAQRILMQEDFKGQIWALSAIDGLFQFNTITNNFDKKLDLINGTSFLIYKDYILIGNDNLNIYSIANKDIKLLRTIPFHKDTITYIHANNKDQFYLGTRKGDLLKMKDVNSKPVKIYVSNEAHRVEKIDFGEIHDIYTTSDTSTNERIWVTSKNGLWLLYERLFNTIEGLPMNNPISISFNADGKGLSPINYIYQIEPKTEQGFEANVIFKDIQANAVVYGNDNSIWISTGTPNVELFKYKDGKIENRYNFQDRGESVFYLYPDSKGNLWFNQAPTDKPIIGTAKINFNGKVTFYDETKGFSSRVLSLKESNRGEIYAAGIGENSYLYKYNPTTDKFENLSPDLPFKEMLNFEAHDLTIDNLGIVWLATTDGLLRYDGEKVILVQDDILGQEEVRGVTHYSNNNIWVATATKGLVFHQKNSSTIIGEREGLPSVISAYRCIETDHNGHLWAGTAEGMVYSRLPVANLPESNVPKIRKIFLDDNEYAHDPDKEVIIKNKTRLGIQFTNLSYPSNDVQYQYHLSPKKDQNILIEEQIWTTQQSNYLDFNNIEAGDYVLEVRAQQPGGYQWSKPLSIQIKIFTPWYMSTWLIYSLITLLIAFSIFYFRNYARKRFKRLQNVLKYSNEKLAKKEKLLDQKITELEEKGNELLSATSNIQTLELFIKGIPKNASWQDIITAMGKAVNKTTDINAFEIAFREKENEIVHKGFSDQERSEFTFRVKPFCTKTSLTCWAMENDKEILINDFKKEHAQYIEEKDAYRFNSLLFIPFKIENDQTLVLCAYSTIKNHFTANDVIMFRILARFIYIAINQEIKK